MDTQALSRGQSAFFWHSSRQKKAIFTNVMARICRLTLITLDVRVADPAGRTGANGSMLEAAAFSSPAAGRMRHQTWILTGVVDAGLIVTALLVVITFVL